MQAAIPSGKGSMLAVLGSSLSVIDEILDRDFKNKCFVANDNSPQQVVVSGLKENILKFSVILNFIERIHNQKFHAVRAFQELNYQVIAAGDSYNDLSMIDQADAGFLFRAPESVRTERSDLECYDDYEELYSAIMNRVKQGF